MDDKVKAEMINIAHDVFNSRVPCPYGKMNRIGIILFWTVTISFGGAIWIWANSFFTDTSRRIDAIANTMYQNVQDQKLLDQRFNMTIARIESTMNEMKNDIGEIKRELKK